MTNEPLSKQAEFSDALILSAIYSSNPAVNGFSELAVRWTGSKTELWSWVDEWGSECLETWRGPPDYEEIIGCLIHDERIPAPVALDQIRITRDLKPLGQMLALVFADGEDHRQLAQMLLRLPERVLIEFAETPGGLWSHALFDVMLEIEKKAREHGIELDSSEVEVPDGQDGLIKRVRRALRATIAPLV